MRQYQCINETDVGSIIYPGEIFIIDKKLSPSVYLIKKLSPASGNQRKLFIGAKKFNDNFIPYKPSYSLNSI